MTGQAGKVGRGLRSIGANIAKLATDAGELTYTVNGVTKSISLFDETTGDMKNTYQVLSEISEDWDKMSKTEQSTLAIAQAGKTQIDVYTSVMSNFDTAINATNTSINSQGSAMEENSKYMESMEAKLNALKAQFQELVLGDGGLNTFLKILIDIGTNLLKFANNDVGQTLIKVTALVGVMVLLTKGVTSFGASIIGTKIKIDLLLASSLGLKDGFLLLTSAMLSNPLFWGATAVVGITLLLAAMDKYNKRLSDSVEKLDNLKQASDQSTSELESLKNQLKNIQEQISAINQDKLSVTDKEQLSLLTEQEENLKRQVALAKEKADIERRRLAEQAKQTLGTTTQTQFGSENKIGGEIAEYAPEVTPVEELQLASQAYENLKNKRQELIDQGAEIEASEGRNSQAYLDNTKQLESNKYQMEEVESRGQEMADVVKSATESAYGNTKAVEKQEKENYGLVDAWLDLMGVGDELEEQQKSQEDTVKELAETYELSEDQIEAIREKMEETGDSAYDTADALGYIKSATEKADDAMKAYKDALSEMSSMDDSFNILNDAISEYNSTGTFTLDTLSNLLSLGNEYVSLLQFENGQISLNKDGAIALANAKIDDAEATAIQSARADIAKVAEEGLGNAIADTSTQAGNSVTNLSKAQQAIVDLGKEAVISSGEVNTLFTALGGKGKLATGSVNEQITKSLANTLASMEKIRNGIGKTITTTSSSTKAVRGNTSARSSNTRAVNKQTRAVNKQTTAQEKLIKKLKEEEEKLKDLKSDYEDVFDYMKDVVEKEIDKLNDKRDKRLQELDWERDQLENNYKEEKSQVENQISLMEKDQQKRNNHYDKVIQSLNDQKDAVESYYDTEIEKLEKVNDEISDQIKLQEYQEALARAKASKKMVLGDSGFEYREDEETVAIASRDLQQYQSEKARQDTIDSLKKQKEIQLKSIEAQIKYQEKMQESENFHFDNEIEEQKKHLEDLETIYDEEVEELDVKEKKINAIYDNLIAKKEDYLDTLKDGEKKYKTLQAKHLAKVLYGKNFENQTNAERLKNLKAFVNAYNATLSQLGNTSSSLSSSKSSNSKTSTSSSSKKKATGDASIKEDGAYIVGDSPNTELIIGSKLNGVPMNLSKGSGVVNAKSTNTLAGILNNLGSLGSNFATNNSSNVSQDIVIENVNLNNVTDGQSFVNEIREFRNSIIQKSYCS